MSATAESLVPVRDELYSHQGAVVPFRVQGFKVLLQKVKLCGVPVQLHQHVDTVSFMAYRGWLRKTNPWAMSSMYRACAWWKQKHMYTPALDTKVLLACDSFETSKLFV